MMIGAIAPIFIAPLFPDASIFAAQSADGIADRFVPAEPVSYPGQRDGHASVDLIYNSLFAHRPRNPERIIFGEDWNTILSDVLHAVLPQADRFLAETNVLRALKDPDQPPAVKAIATRLLRLLVRGSPSDQTAAPLHWLEFLPPLLELSDQRGEEQLRQARVLFSDAQQDVWKRELAMFFYLYRLLGKEGVALSQEEAEATAQVLARYLENPWQPIPRRQALSSRSYCSSRFHLKLEDTLFLDRFLRMVVITRRETVRKQSPDDTEALLAVDRWALGYFEQYSNSPRYELRSLKKQIETSIQALTPWYVRLGRWLSEG